MQVRLGLLFSAYEIYFIQEQMVTLKNHLLYRMQVFVSPNYHINYVYFTPFHSNLCKLFPQYTLDQVINIDD